MLDRAEWIGVPEILPVDRQIAEIFGNGGRGFIDSGASQLSVPTIRLSAPLGRPVVDMTGDITPAGADSAAPDRPSLFTALQEQLGLKLESGKVPADVLVVDHAELPTDN